MHDPMAMRPFMGYNFGKYLDHWLGLNRPPHKVSHRSTRVFIKAYSSESTILGTLVTTLCSL